VSLGGRWVPLSRFQRGLRFKVDLRRRKEWNNYTSRCKSETCQVVTVECGGGSGVKAASLTVRLRSVGKTAPRLVSGVSRITFMHMRKAHASWWSVCEDWNPCFVVGRILPPVAKSALQLLMLTLFKDR
jgi:hypothetical protein